MLAGVVITILMHMYGEWWAPSHHLFPQKEPKKPRWPPRLPGFFFGTCKTIFDGSLAKDNHKSGGTLLFSVSGHESTNGISLQERFCHEPHCAAQRPKSTRLCYGPMGLAQWPWAYSRPQAIRDWSPRGSGRAYYARQSELAPHCRRLIGVGLP
jgi:hypothetical protein